MYLKIMVSHFSVRRIWQTALPVILLLVSLDGPAMGQVAQPAEPGELYAGIELGTEEVKAVALRIYRGEGEPGIKLLYSEAVYLSLNRAENGALGRRASTEVAQAVLKLMARLRQQYQVPAERIFLIGNSELGAHRPEDLVGVINKLTGKTLTFLDVETEVQLSIVGTIPRREKVGNRWIDNRDSSLLMEIGNDSVKGGYQLLKYSPSAQPRYDFVTINIQQGVLSLTNEVSKIMKEGDNWVAFIQSANTSGTQPVREALRQERESKPGLVNRKRIYLTGPIVRALATLLYPEARQTFVAISGKDITKFATRAARDPYSLLKPNLSYIGDQELRQEIGKEITDIRKTFKPQELVVGAELMKAMVGELNWQEKNIWFARFGHFGCILSYVRLQAAK
jgi:hypothetical protein